MALGETRTGTRGEEEQRYYLEQARKEILWEGEEEERGNQQNCRTGRSSRMQEKNIN
jgi:hypothetical protein